LTSWCVIAYPENRDSAPQVYFTTRLGETSTAQRIDTERTTMEKTNDNDGDRLELEALRLAHRAHRSIEQLETHRKYRASEYAERIKRLRKVAQAIGQRQQMGTLALEGLSSITLSEEDLALVHDPLRSL
jgi:hypothetical protein